MVTILAALAGLSVLLALWQWVVAWRFPLHKRVKESLPAPGVTLLKPLKGLDSKTMDCLRSWLAQDYPGKIQVLFGVASAEDPVGEAVKQLIKEKPGSGGQFVVCSDSLGVNAKVSSLIQLLRQAKHDIVVVSDADVFAPPDLLRNLVAPLSDSGVGLVNCFYRLANPAALAMRLEAVAVNADFWSQVLQGRSLQPLDFALGAAMAMRREQIAKIGGFEALADYLADDFQLGHRIAKSRMRIALCPVVVDCLSAPMGWREVWTHQLRWARTIRACKPLPYAMSVLSNATFWPLLLVMACPLPWKVWLFAGCLLIRIVSAQSLQWRLGPVPGQGWFWWLVPIKDLLHMAVWALAFLGNHIVWRGQRFRLKRNGLLVRE